jgi:hypothetical protein
LAVAISHIARNQLVSGSLVAWKIVPAVSETWCRQARHWIFGRVLSHLPSQPPHTQGCSVLWAEAFVRAGFVVGGSSQQVRC